MSEFASIQTLPGSRIRCRETDGELVCYLPPHWIRGFILGAVIVAALVAIASFLAFLSFQVGGPSAFFTVPLGVFAFLVLGIFFWAIVVVNLTTTWVYVTREHLVLKIKVWGRGEAETYHLNERSYAAQYWGSAYQQRHDPARRPHGIVIRSDDDISEESDDTSNESTAHFGHTLSRGELDWVEWRINRFLGRATDAEAPAGVVPSPGTAAVLIEGLPNEPLPAPEDSKFRIEEGVFETRIHFLGTVAMGSYKGIGTTVIGLGVSAWVFLYVIQNWGRLSVDAQSWIACGVGGLFGLLLLFAGLARLFGRSLLAISPERITFRTTLLRIVPFYWKTLRTADVISVGSQKRPRSRFGRVTGPSKGHMIRTASREICYNDQFGDAVRDEAEANWLAGEIALRIQAAHSAAWLLPVWHRQRPLKPVMTAGKLPKGPVPYYLDQRPMPSGTDSDLLLPVDVGGFRRETFAQREHVSRDELLEVEYRSDRGKISITFSICTDRENAQEAVSVAQAEATAHGGHADDRLSLNTEPSFFRTAAPRGAFIAWNRGNYFFTASVRGKNSEKVLDQFMNEFPY